jgi:hypothetical protein
MALADKAAKKNFVALRAKRAWARNLRLFGHVDRINKGTSEIAVMAKPLRPLDRIHRSAQGPEQKSFLEVAGKPDPKFVAER